MSAIKGRDFTAAAFKSCPRAASRPSGEIEKWRIVTRHPCGLRAFDKYGQDDSPGVRRAYSITGDNPARCSELFP
jgi:hypothetical protein